MGPLAVLQEVRKRWFIVGVVVVITLAKIFPPLGAKGGKSLVHKPPWRALNKTRLLLQMLCSCSVVILQYECSYIVAIDAQK